MKKASKQIDTSTEAKIKDAAKKLFTQKGFEAVKTRDIAAEAGINLALLNYYFRSKQKLFDVIMMENMQQFIKGVAAILGNENVSLDEKLEKLVAHYIDILCATPDLALFIFNHIRSAEKNKNGEIEIPAEIIAARTMIQKQLSAAMDAGLITRIDPTHLMANMMSLIIFPFIASPILKSRRGITDKKFMELMQERKTLIPIWLKAMLKPG
jgi:AcrR family transcriptional regulator